MAKEKKDEISQPKEAPAIEKPVEKPKKVIVPVGPHNPFTHNQP